MSYISHLTLVSILNAYLVVNLNSVSY